MGHRVHNGRPTVEGYWHIGSYFKVSRELVEHVESVVDGALTYENEIIGKSGPPVAE